jgi:hypothetical protein
VDEDRPAVINVNMFFAPLAGNELLARLHRFRNRPNGDYACLAGSLTEVQFYPEPESAPVLERHVGRADATPLLETRNGGYLS